MTVDPTYVEVEADWLNHPTRDPFKMHMSGYTRHGGLNFNVPYISLLDEAGDGYHELYHGGCDRRLVLPKEIDNVISLYQSEAYMIRPDCETYVETIEMYDAEGDVDGVEVRRLAEKVNELRKTGTVLVHCQAGLNRSSLIAGASLILTGRFTAKEAIDMMRQKRSLAVLCNKSFEDFVYQFKG